MGRNLLTRAMNGQICFLLNQHQVCTSLHPGVRVLDYLRQVERLTGSKEGCREGACGACTVLVGELQADRVNYQPVTSCLLSLGELQGKHLVTVEGLNQSELSPVQQALIDYGATQCGFCTPGIVVSLTAYLLAATERNTEGIKKALSGNLCRCTGYNSIKGAANALLESIHNGAKLRVEDLVTTRIIPPYFLDIPARLRQLPPPETQHSPTAEFFIAGGTDLYVQQGDILPESEVVFLNQLPAPQIKGIYCQDAQIHIGALTTFTEFSSHPEIIKLLPEIPSYVLHIASELIRNRATLGGNIVAASPIGDGSVLLLALEPLLVFRDGINQRTLPMQDFFRGYKDTAKQAGEILTEIIVTLPAKGTQINFEKVSKRQYSDCAAVNSGMKVRCDANIIREITISMGGVAPIPLFLKQTSAYFLGKAVNANTIAGAFPILQQEISPITDIHGSAGYKRLLARQLLIAHFTKLFPEFVSLRDFYAQN